MKQKKSKGQIILVGLLILMVLFIGKVYMNNKENEKLENQKDSVSEIRQTISGLEEIKFDKDGGQFSKTENDFGKWSIGAKLKLSNSSWYDVDVSKEGIEAMGQGFPDENMEGGTEGSVKVIYSNGESELVK